MGSSISGNVTSTFSTIAVSGQSDIVADSGADTLTMVGSGVTLTTNATTDTLTITGASSPTIGDTQVAYATAANTLGGDAAMTYNGTTDTLTIPNLLVKTTTVAGVADAGTGYDAVKFTNNQGAVLLLAEGPLYLATTESGTTAREILIQTPDVATGHTTGDVSVTAGLVTGSGFIGGASVHYAGSASQSGATVIRGRYISLEVEGDGLRLTGDIKIVDTDDFTWKTFATATPGSTPNFTIGPPSGGTVTLQASTYKSSDGSSGVSVGPLTAITGITVKNGLVVALSGT